MQSGSTGRLEESVAGGEAAWRVGDGANSLETRDDVHALLDPPWHVRVAAPIRRY